MTTPRDLLTRLLDGLAGPRTQRHHLADLYAPDATIDLPYAIPAPLRLTGRDEIRAHLRRTADLPITVHVHDLTTHQTTDPDVIVSEFDYTVHANGHQTTVTNIQVLTAKNGLISATKDFHDHHALADLLDRAITST